MHIESTLPLWLVLPLVALAIFVAWILYFHRSSESVLNKPVRILLAVSRFIVLFVIGLLIISPWIRTATDRKEQPHYVLVQDNSVSIPPNQDKESFIRKRNELIGNINKELNSRFVVKKVLFGTRTVEGDKCSFDDQVTDPGELFGYLRLYAKTHTLGGVLLTTDGIATRGITFSEAARDFPYPVTVLASGDSIRFPDVRIEEVVSNEWVRKNSTFPVRVYYNTGDFAGKTFVIRISGPKGIMDEKLFDLKTMTAPYADFIIKAPEKGTLQLEARIIPDQPDKNQDNNSRRFQVKIIEQEGEILCLYESAHPDIDAIVQSLKGTNSLNIKTLEVSEFTGADKAYDLIILHGLPSLKHPLADLLNLANSRQVPVLFIISRNTDPVLFNRLKNGMVIDNRRKSSEASQGIFNSSFTLFTLPEDFKNHLSTWPPLSLSFETFVTDPGSQDLMMQKILNIDLTDPLVAFASSQGIKYGFFCGEGIWLWRLHEFLEQKNHDYFDDMMSRTVQYLLQDEKKDRFRIILPEELYAYSPVRINGHLLNKSLEEINEPDVSFKVTDSSGQNTEYVMGRINDYYELNINGFPPGSYRYAAETKLGEENLKREGTMTMMVRPVEQSDPVADFESLRSIAKNTGGSFFGPGQESSLTSFFDNLKPSQTRINKEFKWYDLINFKWLLAVLILLLAMEWFLRRWFGIR